MSDCISRQAILDIIDKWYPQKTPRMIKMISEFPSVTPTERTGNWIIIDDCEKFIAKCSECGRIEDSRMISKYSYCHCGARMVEPQESEEISDRNIKMWEEIFKAESEDRE